MNEWVWDVPVPAPGERLLLVAIAHLAGDTDTAIASKADLKKLTNMGPRLDKAQDKLIELGYIDYTRSRGGQPSRYRLVPPSAQPDFTQVIQSQAPAATRNGEYHAAAVAIVKRWYEVTFPRPIVAGGFAAAKKLVELALDAGWTEAQVTTALAYVPTLSAGALEFALRRDSQGSVPPAQPKTDKRPDCDVCNNQRWVFGDKRNEVTPCPGCSSAY